MCVWRERCRESPHCGSPVVTMVLAHCSTDETVLSMLSLLISSVDAADTSLNGRLVALSRVNVEVLPLVGSPVFTRVLALDSVVDVSSILTSDASRFLNAISARSSYRKSPTHTGTLYLSVM